MPRPARPIKKAVAPNRCKPAKKGRAGQASSRSHREGASIDKKPESSKEELRSLNRKLSTANQQLQRKVAKLLNANEDLNNLLVGARKKATGSLEQKVRERTARLRALAGEASLAEERERRLLAQDLHDDLGQLLAIVKHKLTALHAHKGGADLVGELRAIEDLIDKANKSMRTLAFQLSPPVLHTLGLIPALEWLAEEMEQSFGLQVHLSDDGAAKPLDEASRTALFRAARELLINVAKHAKAGSAEILCMCAKGRLTLAVCDKGTGFDYERALAAPPGKGGLGLIGARERIEFIGGEMHVDSRPGTGTTVTLIAPLRAKSGRTAP